MRGAGARGKGDWRRMIHDRVTPRLKWMGMRETRDEGRGTKGMFGDEKMEKFAGFKEHLDMG